MVRNDVLSLRAGRGPLGTNEGRETRFLGMVGWPPQER